MIERRLRTEQTVPPPHSDCQAATEVSVSVPCGLTAGEADTDFVEFHVLGLTASVEMHRDVDGGRHNRHHDGTGRVGERGEKRRGDEGALQLTWGDGERGQERAEGRCSRRRECMYSSLQPSRGIPGEGMATDVIGGPGSCSRSQEYTWRVTVSHSLGIAGPSRGLQLGGARPRLELSTQAGYSIRGRSAARRRAGSWRRLQWECGPRGKMRVGTSVHSRTPESR